MLEPGRVRVSVDGDDAQSELLRAQDRAPLVAPRADEENGLHSRAMLLGKQERHSVPARDLAAVSPGEADRDTPAAERPAHDRFLRPAVDLRADRWGGRGKNGLSFIAPSRLHAAAARTSVPRAGAQSRVRTRDALVGPYGHTVIVKVAGEDTASTSETRAAGTPPD
jgi:hypothetical protein